MDRKKFHLTGIKAQLHRIAATYPHIAQLKTIGQSIQKRPMLVMRLTNEKVGKKEGKPQVLFLATHHAREWLATETAMRLIKYLAANYGFDGRVTNLSVWSNEDYRGSAPNSEPETQALVNFITDNDFKFALSYHTYSNLILYPWGWQVKTPGLDEPIFVAQVGTDSNPAIYDSLLGQGYNPGVRADLYITNGDFTDWAYEELGIPAYTVELTDGYDFCFPDDEAMMQTVFEDNLEFALSMAESAIDPANPISPAGFQAQDVYHTPVTFSYGPDQMIEVLARKGLDLSLTYSLNGGSPQTAGFTEKLGEFYNHQPGTYYSRYEALISGQQVGDLVSYQVVGGSSLIEASYPANIPHSGHDSKPPIPYA